MKKLYFILALLISAFTTQGQSIERLNWINGTWERQSTKPGSTAFESWELINDSFKGMGVTLRGTDTVFVEKLSIIEKDGVLNYVAEVAHNASATYFKMTAISESGFTCENPSHDFPKKIEYSLDGDLLTATISGNGKSIPFYFKKID